MAGEYHVMPDGSIMPGSMEEMYRVDPRTMRAQRRPNPGGMLPMPAQQQPQSQQSGMLDTLSKLTPEQRMELERMMLDWQLDQDALPRGGQGGMIKTAGPDLDPAYAGLSPEKQRRLLQLRAERQRAAEAGQGGSAAPVSPSSLPSPLTHKRRLDEEMAKAEQDLQRIFGKR